MTGVQTCALPISGVGAQVTAELRDDGVEVGVRAGQDVLLHETPPFRVEDRAAVRAVAVGCCSVFLMILLD